MEPSWNSDMIYKHLLLWPDVFHFGRLSSRSTENKTRITRSHVFSDGWVFRGSNPSSHLGDLHYTLHALVRVWVISTPASVRAVWLLDIQNRPSFYSESSVRAPGKWTLISRDPDYESPGLYWDHKLQNNFLACGKNWLGSDVCQL